MRKILLVGSSIILFSCSQSKMPDLDFLIGTWKIEGKEQYEVWEKTEGNELSGNSFAIIDDQKKILETLTIKTSGNQIVYEATVPDQNEGRTIPFTMNDDVKSCLSFENPGHDFPKKIQYELIGADEIKVTVSGNEGEGFSYSQFRQEVK